METSIPPTPQSPMPENLLGVGGQDQVDIVGAGAQVGKGFFDCIRMIDRKIDARADGGIRDGTVPSPGRPSGR